jgi:hypothetical protein
LATFPQRAQFLNSLDQTTVKNSYSKAITRKEGVIPLKRYPIIMQAYLITEGKVQYIELANAITEDVELLSIESKNDPKGLEDILSLSGIKFPIYFKKTTLGSFPQFYKFILISNKKMSNENIIIKARIKNKEDIYIHEMKSYYPALDSSTLPKGDTTVSTRL